MNFQALIVSLLVLTPSAIAQVSPLNPSSAPAGPRTYVPADFAQFAPRTAYDMLSRVPGFGIKQEDSEERGLGEATGNVVINGQRISAKSNDVVAELTRIPATNVERIEIVDGATLEIPGLSGQVANVIVRPTGISGQWAYRPELRAYYADPLFTRFEVSISGRKGPVQYSLGVENRGSRGGAGGPTWILNRDMTLREERDEEWRSDAERPRLSGRFVLDGPGDSKGNLNILYGRVDSHFLLSGTRTTASGTRNRRHTQDDRGDNYELGGDYVFDLGQGALKIIGMSRSTSYPQEITVVDTYADGSASGVRSTREGTERELIGRGEYRWKIGKEEWQVSVEGAFNNLDNASRLFVMQPDRTFDEVPLPGGSARVEEDRYEVVGSYGRPITRLLTMKLSVGGEYSQLAQVGAGGTTRDFYRPKGEISTAWKVSARTDINFKIARRVGQLDFFDFLAFIDVASNIDKAANPALVPEQNWDVEFETVRNLGSLGSTTLRVYGRRIDDIIDYIPIGETGQSPGNLDHASMYGIQSRSTLNLNRLGWNGARVDATLQWQDSEVEDPLTSEARPISNSLQEFVDLALRHDLTRSVWAWGATYSYQLNAKNYRLTEVGRLRDGPYWATIYFEHKNVAGMTVRASVNNLLAADSTWDRTVHEGRRTAAIDFIEHRDRQIGPILSFQVRGKF